MAGLVLAINEWSSLKDIALMFESYGRSFDLTGLDLSRTVGWFTRLYTVRYQLCTLMSHGDIIADVKDTRRKLTSQLDFARPSTL